MFLVKWFRWLFGYVVFKATGRYPERFLNDAAKQHINLWDIQSQDKAITASVAKADYRSLRPIARNAKTVPRIQKRRGLPFFLARYCKRWGVLVGAALFVGMLAFLSMYVWSIQVEGNNTLSTDEVKQVVMELGLKPGTLKSSVEAHELAQQAMLRLPEAAWISVNVTGSVATVNISERLEESEIVPQEDPCNLIAERDGQIIRMDVYAGEAEVKNGDAVVKGQLLVNAVEENAQGESTLNHAYGFAYAKTTRELTQEFQFQQRVQTGTSEVIERKRLCLFGLGIPISLAQIPNENYQKKLTYEEVSIFGATLPIGIYTEEWSEPYYEDVTYTKEEALAHAKELLQQRESVELSDCTILERQEQVEYTATGVVYCVTYTCEEDIALQQPIALEGESPAVPEEE